MVECRQSLSSSCYKFLANSSKVPVSIIIFILPIGFLKYQWQKTTYIPISGRSLLWLAKSCSIKKQYSLINWIQYYFKSNQPGSTAKATKLLNQGEIAATRYVKMNLMSFSSFITGILKMLLGAVHKWCRQFFEIFYPSLPLVTHLTK